MTYKIQNEAPFQILGSSFTIGPSSTGYELQVGATPRDFATLFTVAANTTRMVTNVANGSYYRLKGNSGEVVVNWQRTCKGEAAGGGNAGELEPVTEFPVGAAEGTVVSLVSGDTMGLYQYDGSDWVAVGGADLSNYYTKQETNQAISAATQDLASTDYVDDAIAAIPDPDLSNYYTKQETDAAITSATQDFVTEAYVDAAITSATQDFVTEADITAATSTIQEQLDDVERVTATALTELHQDILALSGATPDMSDYYTKDEVDAEITGATQDFATEAYVTAATENMVTTGDIQNFVTSGDVATQISTATANMVESTSVSTIWKGTQAEYDLIANPDPNTFYIITNN